MNYMHHTKIFAVKYEITSEKGITLISVEMGKIQQQISKTCLILLNQTSQMVLNGYIVISHNIPPNPAKFRQNPSNPAKSREIPPNPAKSRQIPPNPAKSRQILPNPAKSRQIPPNTAKYRHFRRFPPSYTGGNWRDPAKNVGS